MLFSIFRGLTSHIRFTYVTLAPSCTCCLGMKKTVFIPWINTFLGLCFPTPCASLPNLFARGLFHIAASCPAGRLSMDYLVPVSTLKTRLEIYCWKPLLSIFITLCAMNLFIRECVKWKWRFFWVYWALLFWCMGHICCAYYCVLMRS